MPPVVLGLRAHLGGMETLSNPMAALEPLLSTQQLADYLGVPVKTIYEWRTGGRGPCAVRVGRHLKFAVSDVHAWVAQQRETSPGTTPHRGELMPGPRTPIGTFGQIKFTTTPSGSVRARTRFRDIDGQLRPVDATARTRKAAEHALKEKLTQRVDLTAGTDDLTADSSFAHLVEVWLRDLDLEDRLATSTRALYERNMRQLVLPAFAHLALREISVRRVDQFLKEMASKKSHSKARQARTANRTRGLTAHRQLSAVRRWVAHDHRGGLWRS